MRSTRGSPGDAAQQAGDIMSQGLMDAGFRQK